MEIRVYLSGGGWDHFPNAWKYQTNEQGELDILADNEFPIATYAKEKWVSVRRLKEPDEEWPDPETKTMRTDEDDEERPEILDGLPDFLGKDLGKGKPRPGESQT